MSHRTRERPAECLLSPTQPKSVCRAHALEIVHSLQMYCKLLTGHGGGIPHMPPTLNSVTISAPPSKKKSNQNECVSLPDKHKFDSRTYVKPKRRPQRPSVHTVLDIPPASQNNKYLTYNKYNHAPILRLKTFNVDTDSENSGAIKDYALKRRSLVQDEEQQNERTPLNNCGDAQGVTAESAPSKPIDIDLSQPAHNLHNTFNKGYLNNVMERGSLGMYQSGESLMRMSPPSLVSSLLMDSSDTFNQESLESRKSLLSTKDSGVGPSSRESRDPMMTSMTLSILDEKDMSTSFLSQTTYPDNDSLIDSLPPSLISSVNSSCVMSTNTSKMRPDSTEPTNLFSSATFTHLDQNERLLTGRPRVSMYNSYTKRDSTNRQSDKIQDEPCPNENDKQNTTLGTKTHNVDKISPEMGETITLHYANNKFHDDADKENLNDSFQKDDAFYRDMGIQKPTDVGRNSLNVTLDKRELNEIIQARQKLSLARKGLPNDMEKTVILPNQAEGSPNKTIQVLNQTITVPKHSMENASELLARRRHEKRAEEGQRETPKRNSTFKISPKTQNMDTTVVYIKQETQKHPNIIDINSATLDLIGAAVHPIQHEHQVGEWSGERAMVCSSETDTDTGTFSSSSPPDAHDTTLAPHHDDDNTQVASTPIVPLRKGTKNNLLNIHNTISPILDSCDNQKQSNHTHNETVHNTTVINSATIVRRHGGPQRDILAGKISPENRRTTHNITPPKTSPNRLSPTNTERYPGHRVFVNVHRSLTEGGHVPNQIRAGGRPSSSYEEEVLHCKRSQMIRVYPFVELKKEWEYPKAQHITAFAPPMGIPRKTGLPTSKMRQYSSHKDLSRIPGAPSLSNIAARGSVAGLVSVGGGAGRSNMVRRSVYASNPALSPTAPTPPAYFALTNNVQLVQMTEKAAPRPALVRQGTETLRRERPQSQLVAPKELRVGTYASLTAVSGIRNYNHIPAPISRPSSTAGSAQPRVARPTPPVYRPAGIQNALETRPSTAEPRASALPRPTRLPAPRRRYLTVKAAAVSVLGSARHRAPGAMLTSLRVRLARAALATSSPIQTSLLTFAM
ncbi:hypothetical protein EVAR_33189_1 [Eumeta japonica]|uniref:Uncharacterized protein n=1 Tax=Eumeta variegata TaxID=151549 RepID=A0A4C1W4I2_EUMVA|nr:hypothetical protein EVAR_33189_1 [Eumeta japonica]